MKKFKVGDIVEAPWTAVPMARVSAFRYEVTRQDEKGVWRGRYLGTDAPDLGDAVLGVSPGKWKLIERKSKRERELEAKLGESDKALNELNTTAAGAKAEKELLERQIEVDAWARDEAMFAAGYISIRALKAITAQDGLFQSDDGFGHREAKLRLIRRSGAPGKMYDSLLKELRAK